MRPKARETLFRLCIVSLPLLLLLYALCVPFYSGSSIGGHLSWRLEHGRMTVRARGAASREAFYVAPNSEGLRFKPEVEFGSLVDWRLTMPLWVPVLGAGVGAWICRPRRESKAG